MRQTDCVAMHIRQHTQSTIMCALRPQRAPQRNVKCALRTRLTVYVHALLLTNCKDHTSIFHWLVVANTALNALIMLPLAVGKPHLENQRYCRNTLICCGCGYRAQWNVTVPAQVLLSALATVLQRMAHRQSESQTGTST